MLSLSKAISVDYYPPEHHGDHVKYIEPQHPGHVKYVEPHHAHPGHVKYIEQQHPGHVKYIEPAHAHPGHVKYIEPAHLKQVNYIQSAPIVKQAVPVKYVHQDPHAVKYIENPHYAKHVDYDEPAHYEYGYDVHDDHTGDYKSHTEKRDGNTVHGRYEVLDPDGFKRIVEYTADEHNGFNAVVRREPSDLKVVKKVYDVHQPEFIKSVPQPIKYYPQQSSYVQPQQKYFSAPVHQKIVQPIVKQYTTPQYYAPPEHPKFFKPAVEKVTKFVKPVYDSDPHTGVKYVQPHYNQY